MPPQGQQGADSLLRVEVLSGASALDGLRPCWDELSRVADCDYFQTWEWVKAWSDILEPRADLQLVLATDSSGRAVGLLPLASMSRGLHSRVALPLRYVGLAGSGAGAGDHLGPLVTSSGALVSLVDSLRPIARRRPILLENVAATYSQAIAELLGADLIDAVRCPVIVLPPDRDVSRLWPNSLRKNLRRRRQQMLDAGMRMRWISPGAHLSEMLTHLEELHAKRWQAKGGAGLFTPRRREFLTRLSVLAKPPEGPWLLVVEKDADVVATMVGFRFKDSFYSYMTGWDPDYKRFGLGSALTAETLSFMEAEGLTTFDYLRGSEPNKYVFGASDRIDHTLLRCSIPWGSLLKLREAAAIRRANVESGRGVCTAADAAEAGDHQRDPSSLPVD